MPIESVICPDKVMESVDYCLNGCDHRCMTRPMASQILSEREQRINWVCPCCGGVIKWQAKE